MMEWDDETREWWFEKAKELAEQEEAEMKKARAKGRGGRGRRR